MFLRAKSDYPPHKVAKLPNLSPTMETGAIQSWAKNEGDRLDEGDVLCQVETDKAVMAMETPYSGFLAKILIPSGTKNIAVGQPIALIVRAADEVAAFTTYAVGGDNTPNTHNPSIVTPNPNPIVSTNPNLNPTIVSKPNVNNLNNKINNEINNVNNNVNSNLTVNSRNQSIKFATPYAKNLIKTNNININSITGTGPDNLIISKDVLNNINNLNKAAENSAASSKSVSQQNAGSYIDIELTSMRATIARRLGESMSTIPHFYIYMDVEMDALMSLRNNINKQLNIKNIIKLSINDFIIKAAALTLIKIPQCNAQWHDKFIRQFSAADVAVAVSTPAGLITPIIFNACAKPVGVISAEMKILAEKAKNNTLKLAEFQGGTFTISNLGMFGVSDFTAIINPPQCCILAVGGISARYVQTGPDSAPAFKNYMRVTLGCDHRVVDGAVGALWLKTFKEIMESPYEILV